MLISFWSWISLFLFVCPCQNRTVLVLLPVQFCFIRIPIKLHNLNVYRVSSSLPTSSWIHIYIQLQIILEQCSAHSMFGNSIVPEPDTFYDALTSVRLDPNWSLTVISGLELLCPHLLPLTEFKIVYAILWKKTYSPLHKFLPKDANLWKMFR